MGKYQKDFVGWARVAEKIEKRERPSLVKPGAIYWVALGVNIGSIEDGKGEEFTRPVLVLSTFNKGQILVIPLTSQIKSGPNTQRVVICGRYEYLLFAQTRPIDLKCCGNFMDELDKITFSQVKKNYLRYLKLLLYKK